MRLHAGVTLMMLTFACLAGSAHGENPQPEWRDAGRVITLVGEVQRPGIYGFNPERPIPLCGLIIASGGVKEPKYCVIVLLRASDDGASAKSIQIDAARVMEDGQIALAPNDVVHVRVRKPGD